MADERKPLALWPAYAAATWAFAHAAMSAYWAAGGTLGLTLLSEGIQEQAAAREAWFVALVAGVAAAKSVAGALALALARQWGRALPRWLLLLAAWAAGAAFVLYGLAGLALGLLVTSEVIVPPVPPEPSLTWYLVLWYPLWLLGGVLFLAAAWQATKAGRDRRAEVSRDG